MIPCWYLWGFFWVFLKYNHSSVDTVVFRYRYTCWNHSCCWYLGGFFLSIVTTLLLMRLLNLWIVYCFFTLNVLVFRCCVQSFCCCVDELVLRGVLTVVLWLYRCFVEVFWRRLNNFNRGAVRVEGTIYFFFSLQSYGPLPKVMQPTLARLGNIKRQ